MTGESETSDSARLDPSLLFAVCGSLRNSSKSKDAWDSISSKLSSNVSTGVFRALKKGIPSAITNSRLLVPVLRQVLVLQFEAVLYSYMVGRKFTLFCCNRDFHENSTSPCLIFRHLRSFALVSSRFYLQPTQATPVQIPPGNDVLRDTSLNSFHLKLTELSFSPELFIRWIIFKKYTRNIGLKSDYEPDTKMVGFALVWPRICSRKYTEYHENTELKKCRRFAEDAGIDCVRDILTWLETNQHVPLFLITLVEGPSTYKRLFLLSSNCSRRLCCVTDCISCGRS